MPIGGGPVPTLNTATGDVSVPAGTPAVQDNATDAFSTQLLATILALRQSGSLTPEVLAKVAALLD